jgi:hypothetical protein
MGYQSFPAFEAEELPGKGQSMDQSKEPGKEIDQRQALLLYGIVLINVVNTSGGNSERNKEFYPAGINMNIVQRAQRQRKGVTNGKSGYQHHYFFPVLPQIAEAQGGYEQDVVQCVEGKNVLSSQLKIKCKILHIAVMVFKIIKRFVTLKFSCSMVILLYKWLFLVSSLLNGGHSEVLPARHPLYVSVTEMNYNAAEKNLEISCKIFTDDFEKTLANSYRTKVDLTTPASKAEADKMVKEYIKTHLQLKLDGKAVSLEFVGFEKENDAVWSYFEVRTAAAPKKIEVVNTILYESYDKQMNLMHVTVGGNRKSTRLNNPDKEAAFLF